MDTYTKEFENRKLCIEAFIPFLKEKLDVDICKLFTKLFGLKYIFNEDQIAQVLQGSDDEAVEEFFQNLLSAMELPEGFVEFLEMLKMKGFGHIVDILEEKQKPENMVIMRLWKKAFQENFAELTELNPLPILFLYGPEIFDPTTLKSITSKSSRAQKMIEFLYYLPKQSNWFVQFITALKDPDCGNLSHFAKLLDPEDNLQGHSFVILIQWCKPLIVEQLDPDSILDSMTMSPKSELSINAETCREERVQKFLSVLTSSSVCWFEEFKAALAKHEQYSSLVNLLDPEHRLSPSAQPPSEQPSDADILMLRHYQWELANPALKGNNSMIVAPTGSGKTYVALKVCLEHIKSSEKPKVIFLAPNGSLVDQQYEKFKGFMKKENQVLKVRGGLNLKVPVHKLIERHVVTVMTPQILLNLLKERLMNISDITLLIMDECHCTVKKDPYNKIMGIYLDERMENLKAKLPQLLGLTASPGLGVAKNMEKAHNNIKTLMANLDVTIAPVQVKESAGNLMFYQHEAHDEVIPVIRRKNDPFFDKVKQVMQTIERRIANDINKFLDDLEEGFHFDPKAEHGTQVYESQAVTLRDSSKLVKHVKASQHFQTYAKNLLTYNKSLMLNDHVGKFEARKYIKDSLFSEFSAVDIELQMKNLFKANVCDTSEDQTSALLDQLTETLRFEFSKKPNSRCIIFVKTREIVRSLLDYLSKWSQSNESKASDWCRIKDQRIR